MFGCLSSKNKSRSDDLVKETAERVIGCALARDPTSDLRSEFEKAMRTYPRWEVHEAFTQMTLKWSDRSNFNDVLFLDGAPLGPLETLQVYSTDFSGFDILEPKVFRADRNLTRRSGALTARRSRASTRSCPTRNSLSGTDNGSMERNESPTSKRNLFDLSWHHYPSSHGRTASALRESGARGRCSQGSGRASRSYAPPTS